MRDTVKALAIDLDGTLLVGEDLSARNRDAVKAASESGYQVIIATARWRQLAEDISGQIGLSNLPVIACSGAQVYSTSSGEDIYDTRLPERFVTRLYQILNENRCIASATVNAHTWLKLEPEPPADVLSRDLKWVAQLPVPTELPRIATVQGSGTIEIVRALHRDGFEDAVNIFDSIGPSGKTVITITAKDADKGIALEKACSHLNIKTSDVLAFGDAENDIAMFRLAGNSVAMGQASDQIKGAATHVTADNTDDGVAQFIEENLL